MKMMHGADFLPCSNMSRTRAAPTPTNISTKSEPLMERTGHPLRLQWRAPAASCPCPAGRPSTRPLECGRRVSEIFRVTQKLDELLHFVLCFLDTGDIAERDFVFVAGEHARLRFAEIKRAFPSHADLLAKQEIKHEQEQARSAESQTTVCASMFDSVLIAGCMPAAASFSCRLFVKFR